MSGLMGMGADGSAPDLEAVVWTAREAEVRDLTLGALHCAGPARPSAPGCLSAQGARLRLADAERPAHPAAPRRGDHPPPHGG